MKKIFLILLVSIIYNCNTFPKQLEKPSSKDSSILAVSINMKAQIGPQILSPTKVFFILLNEKDDLTKGTNYIASNYAEDDIAYLIDAKPGRYVVAAAEYDKASVKTGGKYSEFEFFNKEAISATEIKVKPGEFSFMGIISLQNKVESLKSIQANGDDAQKHYSKLLNDFAKEYTGLIIDNIQNSSLNNASNTASDRDAAIRKSKENLKETGWLSILK